MLSAASANFDIVVVAQITAAEGSIGGTAGYAPPVLMKWLLVVLYGLYLFLLAVTELVPTNEWNSLWIGSILTFSTVSFYQISTRYGNPMKKNSRMSGQKPFVSMACVDTEVAITGIFARTKTTTLDAATGMKFSLRP